MYGLCIVILSLFLTTYGFNHVNYNSFKFNTKSLKIKGKNNDNYENDELIPKSPQINVKRGLLQGGAFLGLGLLATGSNIEDLLPKSALAIDSNGSNKLPLIADNSIMNKKSYGTGGAPVQKDLRWGCDIKTADRICNFNRAFAEYAGYFTTTRFFNEVDRAKETTYYDSITGKPLFIAPRGRTFEDFEAESRIHGWPSFRDEEVVWENVRCLKDGETVSLSGTHLGHNLPDRKGNRYCINLVSIAGKPIDTV